MLPFLTSGFLTVAGAVPAGQQLITASTPFTVPANVETLHFMTVTRGGDAGTDGASYSSSGGGGAIAWLSFPVVPGEDLDVVVTTAPGGDCGIKRGSTWLVRATNASQQTAGSVITGAGFNGGAGQLDVYGPGFAYGGGSAGSATSAGSAGGVGESSGGFGSSIINGAPVAPSSTNGGMYGGGAAIIDVNPGAPGAAAARAMWGLGRAPPNTNTADV